MNYQELQKDEARCLIYAFRKALESPDELTSQMEQFYGHSIKELEAKLSRIEAGSDGRPVPSPRSRSAQVPKPWPN